MGQYWVTQRDFDVIHRMFVKGRLDRQGYVDECNRLYRNLDPKFKPNIDRRRDGRDFGMFCLFIHDNTLRERFLVDEWAKMMGYNITIKDNGIDNSGKFVIDPGGRGGRPDYLYTDQAGKQHKLEVKFNPCQAKNTFKLYDLNNYRNDMAFVLVIMGETRMIGPNGAPGRETPLSIPPNLLWCIFDHHTIDNILDHIPIKNHREVGYKPGVQLDKSNMGIYLNIQKWQYPS